MLERLYQYQCYRLCWDPRNKKKILFSNLILMALEETLAGTSCLLGALLVVSWWASTTSSLIFFLGISEVSVSALYTHQK